LRRWPSARFCAGLRLPGAVTAVHVSALSRAVAGLLESWPPACAVRRAGAISATSLVIAWMGAREAARREPSLAREGLRGAARYYERRLDDARLTLAIARSAISTDRRANHARVVGLMQGAGQVIGAVVREKLPGARLKPRRASSSTRVGRGRSHSLDGRGASGQGAGGPRGPSAAPTKGVHMLVRPRKLNSQHAIAFDSPRDRRICTSSLGRVLPSSHDRHRFDKDRTN